MSGSTKKKLRKEQKLAAMTEKQKQAKREAKKVKAYTISFVIAMVLVVAIVVGVFLSPYVTGLLRRHTNAVTIGNHNLTADELTYYYIDAISNHYDQTYSQYYSYYGNYWTLGLGYDPTVALNKQTQNKETNASWADYFIQLAIDNAESVYALYDLAMSQDYKLSEEDQKELDDNLASLSTIANYYNKSVDAYLREIYGVSASEGSYRYYYTVTSIASAFYNDYSDSLKYDYEDYRAYENEKDEDGKNKLHLYTTYSYVYHSMNMSAYLGEGTKNESGATVWSDAEKEEARAKLMADIEKLKAAGINDKESFDKALQELDLYKYDKEGKPVEDNKKTTAKESKDTFYSGIYVNDAAKEWLISDERQPGEFDLFPIYDSSSADEEDESKKIINGYYLVLFNERDTNEVNMVNIRHILVKFEGGTKDSDGNTTYTESEKQAAKLEAEKILKEYTDGIANETDFAKKEEKFAELANKKSDDKDGKVTDGGIYEDVYPGMMVEPFENWCFEEGRQPGDTGLVETEYGWHVMFYSSTDELTYRDYMIDYDMRMEDLNEWHEDLLENIDVNILNLKYMEYDYIVG